MTVGEKLIYMLYAKVELRELLINDEYEEIEFIANDLKISKQKEIEEIKKIVTKKRKTKTK